MVCCAIAVQKKVPPWQDFLNKYLNKDQAVTFPFPLTFAITSSAILFGAGA
jgi:hypothetical protein